MQVFYNNFQLTGDDPSEWVDKFQAQTSSDVEVSKVFRSDIADVFDRGNAVTSITFNVGRSHANWADAFYYAVRWPRTIPRQQPNGVVKLVMPFEGVNIKLQFKGALETVGTTEVIGLYTIATFKLTLGAEITTK